jgi:hypothetical protein
VNRIGVTLLTIGHTVDDIYQGAVPVLLPFLVAERHYSYAAASGLVLAGNLFSSIAQPAFGGGPGRAGGAGRRQHAVPAPAPAAKGGRRRQEGRRGRGTRRLARLLPAHRRDRDPRRPVLRVDLVPGRCT